MIQPSLPTVWETFLKGTKDYDIQYCVDVYKSSADLINPASTDLIASHGEHDIFDISISTSLFDEYGIGNCCSAKLELKMKHDEEIPKGAMFRVSVNLHKDATDEEEEIDTGYEPLGTFFIQNRTEDPNFSNMTEFVCYDVMMRGEQTYNTEWIYAPALVVLNDLVVKLGLKESDTYGAYDSRITISDTLSVYGKEFDAGITLKIPDDITIREMLQYVCTTLCCNAYITRENRFMLKPVNVGYTLDDSGNPVTDNSGVSWFNIYGNVTSLTVGNKVNYISTVKIYDEDDNWLSQTDGGDGQTLELTLPYISEEIRNNIYNYMVGDTTCQKPYLTFTAESAGWNQQVVDDEVTIAGLTPFIEPGDVVTVGLEGKRTTSFADDIKFNVDMRVDISAPGADELEDEYPYQTADEKKISRILTTTKKNLGSQKTNDAFNIESTSIKAATTLAQFDLDPGTYLVNIRVQIPKTTDVETLGVCITTTDATFTANNGCEVATSTDWATVTNITVPLWVTGTSAATYYIVARCSVTADATGRIQVMKIC